MVASVLSIFYFLIEALIQTLHNDPVPFCTYWFRYQDENTFKLLQVVRQVSIQHEQTPCYFVLFYLPEISMHISLNYFEDRIVQMCKINISCFQHEIKRHPFIYSFLRIQSIPSSGNMANNYSLNMVHRSRLLYDSFNPSSIFRYKL